MEHGLLYFITPKCLDYFFCQKELGTEGGDGNMGIKAG